MSSAPWRSLRSAARQLSTAAQALPSTTTTTVMHAISAREFPRWALTPKEETGAHQFIRKHPEWDGRGIRIAILDTGVDPAAPGLGSRVVDLIDATGTGDVALKEVEPLPTGTSSKSDGILLPSPTGRHLRVSSSWNNPTGRWKVGYKLAYELWPEDLVKRRKTERRREWDAAHHELLAAAQGDLATFKAAKPPAVEKKSTKDDTATGIAAEKEKRDNAEADSRRLMRKDLEDRLEALNELASAYEDPGPVLEAVVWHDGKVWRAVVGGSENDAIGIPVDNKEPLDLSAHKAMADFNIERHYEVFGRQDLLTYSVNIYGDGELLSIVTLSGSHGTHVAGITAASYPDTPELNGIAPGAEIVSIKIGDRRVKGMETSQALLRAATAILKTGCDICNMSFGEDGAWLTEDKGAFISALRDEVVRRRDVIFVTSAGNAGPALSTIGAPANCASLFSIGAYVTKSMQAAEYAMLESVPSGPTTWCSRGPTADGDKGMVCFAPGAAITSVPRYVLKHTQLMNGTSMASPSACGSIALILSALKQEQLRWTPASVHKAVQWTSKDVDDPQGVGLLQVEKAHDYLVSHNHPDTHAEWLVQMTPQGRGEPMRGVYLRGYEETRSLQQIQANVVPKFKEQETDLAANLDLNVTLVCTQSWIRAPEFVSLNGAGRQFSIRVDPSGLSSGYHTGEIQARDGERIVFVIPITVAKPEKPSDKEVVYRQKTSPGAMQRHYLAVPQGATWAELTVQANGNETPIQWWLHGVQLLPLRRLSKTEESFVLALVANEPLKRKIKVVGGTTLELVATQGWNSLGTAEVELKVEFHGLEVVGGAEHLTLHGGDVLTELAVASQIRPEALSPSLTFEWRRAVLGPKDASIRTLTERDRLADGRNLFQLILSYPLKLAKKSTVKLISASQGNLYDNAFAVLGTVQDSRGRLHHFADVYEKEIELDKGDYTYRLQLVHSDLSVLEKAKTLPLKCDIKLDGAVKGIGATFVRDHIDAFTAEKVAKFEGIKVQNGERRAFLIDGRLTGDVKALYEEAKAGDLLIGKLLLAKGAEKAAVPLSYVLPPAPPKEDKDEPKAEAKKLIDHQVEMAKKLEDEKEKLTYLESLIKANPEHLPTLVAHLEALKPKDFKKAEAEKVQAVDAAAEAILKCINVDSLATFYGFKRQAETTEAKREKSKRDLEKDALVAALTAKSEALIGAVLGERDEGEAASVTGSAASSDEFESVRFSSPRRASTASLSDLDALYERMTRWTEPAPHKNIALLHARREQFHGRQGSALLTTIKFLKELGTASSDAKWADTTDLKCEILAELKWDIWIRYEAKRRLICAPPSGDALF